MAVVAKIDDRILLVKSTLSKPIFFFNLKDRTLWPFLHYHYYDRILLVKRSDTQSEDRTLNFSFDPLVMNEMQLIRSYKKFESR